MDLRDAYFSALHARCGRDPSIIVLTGDFDAHWLNKIEQDYPGQYFNVGIAEQNMISVSAGLALEGRKVFVCGQNNFITLRAMEQISVDLCQMRLPVTLVGVGAGFAFSIDGPTHHGVTDLGMMMQLPMRIYNVSDSEVAIYCAGLDLDCPAYVRLGKDDFTPLCTNAPDDYGFRVVIDRTPMEGMPVIVSSGRMVRECLKAIEGTPYGLIDLYRPHPLDGVALCDATYKRKILVVEDNLGNPIAKALGEHGICPSEYLFEYGTEADLLKKAGIDTESIRKAING